MWGVTAFKAACWKTIRNTQKHRQKTWNVDCSQITSASIEKVIILSKIDWFIPLFLKIWTVWGLFSQYFWWKIQYMQKTSIFSQNMTIILWKWLVYTLDFAENCWKFRQDTRKARIISRSVLPIILKVHFLILWSGAVFMAGTAFLVNYFTKMTRLHAGLCRKL